MQLVPVTLKALKPKETDFEPRTFGQHLLRRRLILKLSQKGAGLRLGVTPQTVLHWEKGQTEPPIECMPAIIRFLGYDPFPEPTDLPDRLFAKRRAMGWTIKEAARQLGVDEGTWGAWERGKTVLFRKHRALIAQLLGVSAEEICTVAKWPPSGIGRTQEYRPAARGQLNPSD